MTKICNRSESGLSARGQRLLHEQTLPAYLKQHIRRSSDPNYIPLCVAENQLMWDLLEPKLTASRNVPASALAYDCMTGSLPFRQGLSRFFARTFIGREIPPEQIAVLAGAGSVLETLFYAIADPGDGVLVPTPSYAGFWMDLETRDAVKIVPVHRSPENGFRLTPALLDRAVAEAGCPVRALLYTSPDNPLGTVPSCEELEAVLAWSETAGIHIVFDEIYALSVFGERTFTSCAHLRQPLGQRLHIVWAFSKDFAASGLRCGVLVSENEQVLAAVDGLAYWSCCSGDTQHLLACMVEDDAWVDTYLSTMRSRLRQAYLAVTAVLEQGRIPFLRADAGFFVLLDLREFLNPATWQGENELWLRLLENEAVNLTPGAALRADRPGYARLCFAGVSTDLAIEGTQRVVSALSQL